MRVTRRERLAPAGPVFKRTGPPLMRLLVTGSAGFVGRWALDMLGVAADANESAGDCRAFEPVPLPPQVDLRDAGATRAAVAELRPDAVLHLAGQSFVPRSFEAPAETLEINLFGTLNLLQALDAAGFSGRLLYVSSADVYGQVQAETLPIGPEHPTAPRSPYAVSKLAAETLCQQWQRCHGLDLVIVRPFNHVGPRQDPRFVVPALARQVRRVARGQADRIVTGDLSASRDFLDVRDVVRAYAALLLRGESGRIYTLGSGDERRIDSVLEQLCRLAGVRPRIELDPARLRPSEQRRVCADPSLLMAHTGWSPRLCFEQTLSDILASVDSTA